MKCTLAAAACGLMLLSPVAQSAEIKVLSSGAIKDAALELFQIARYQRIIRLQRDKAGPLLLPR